MAEDAADVNYGDDDDLYDDQDGDDADNDDIYIMMECVCVSNEKVITSWILGDDDIYIYMLPKLHSANPRLHLPDGLASRQRHQLKAKYNYNEWVLS